MKLRTYRRWLYEWLDDHINQISAFVDVVSVVISFVFNWGLFLWSLSIIYEYHETPVGAVPFGKVVVVGFCVALVLFNSIEGLIKKYLKVKR